MVTTQDIREFAVALPQTEESRHFGLPSFKVNGKTFVVIEKGDQSAILSVDQSAATESADADPTVFETVWRQHGHNRIFVGCRVNLVTVSVDSMQELIKRAWLNKAPKRLAATLDEQSKT